MSLNSFFDSSTKSAEVWVRVMGVFWFRYWNLKDFPSCSPFDRVAPARFGILDRKNASAAF